MQLSVWAFEGLKASLELRLRSTDIIQSIAPSSDAAKLTYSSLLTRQLFYDENKCRYDLIKYPAAMALAYDANRTLYGCTIEGKIFLLNTDSINVGFPPFRLAVSGDGNYICASGMEQTLILEGSLREMVSTMSKLKTPISAICFQPGRKKIFLTNGEDSMYYFIVKKKKSAPRLTTKLGYMNKTVAPNSISVDPSH